MSAFTFASNAELASIFDGLRPTHYAEESEQMNFATYEPVHNITYVASPMLASPRPIALPAITDAQRLEEMVKIDADLQDIKRVEVMEIVSPCPVALPAITDADRLAKIAEEQTFLEEVLFFDQVELAAASMAIHYSEPVLYQPRPIEFVDLDSPEFSPLLDLDSSEDSSDSEGSVFSGPSVDMDEADPLSGLSFFTADDDFKFTPPSPVFDSFVPDIDEQSSTMWGHFSKVEFDFQPQEQYCALGFILPSDHVNAISPAQFGTDARQPGANAFYPVHLMRDH